jgi:hypothetical protein
MADKGYKIVPGCGVVIVYIEVLSICFVLIEPVLDNSKRAYYNYTSGW